MTNGNGVKYFTQEARIRIATMRSAMNEEVDRILKWIDEHEQQKLKEERSKPTPPVADNSVIKSELITKGGSEEA